MTAQVRSNGAGGVCSLKFQLDFRKTQLFQKDSHIMLFKYFPLSPQDRAKIARCFEGCEALIAPSPVPVDGESKNLRRDGGTRTL